MQNQSRERISRRLGNNLYNTSKRFKVRDESQKQQDKISDPIIDKIRLMKTFTVRDDMPTMLNAINTVQDFDVKPSRAVSCYTTCKTFHLPSNDPNDPIEKMWVGINPKNRQITLEWCPSKLADEAHDLLDCGLFNNTRHGSFLNCYQDAKVMQIDTCRNIFDMEMEDFIFLGTNTQKRAVYVKKGAIIETIYLGDKECSQFRIYDKSTQDKKAYLEHPIVVRVERKDTMPNLLLRDLVNYENPLLRAEIYKFDDQRLPCVPKNYRQLFKYASWAAGIKSALEAIEVTGAANERALRQLRSKPWEPWVVAQESWKTEWMEALEAYHLLVKATQKDDE